MNALLEALAASDDEHGDYGIRGADWDRRGNTLSLRVTVTADATQRAMTTEWAVTCTDVLEHRLTLGIADGFEWTPGPHPLLWPHVEPERNLFLASRSANAAEVVGLLLTAHHDAVRGWLPAQRFFNTETKLEELLRGGFGLLARAPASLAKVYGDVLDEARIGWSAVETRPSRTWDPASCAWVPVDPERLSVLTLGESFVVASGFSAARA